MARMCLKLMVVDFMRICELRELLVFLVVEDVDVGGLVSAEPLDEVDGRAVLVVAGEGEVSV